MIVLSRDPSQLGGAPAPGARPLPMPLRGVVVSGQL